MTYARHDDRNVSTCFSAGQEAVPLGVPVPGEVTRVDRYAAVAGLLANPAWSKAVFRPVEVCRQAKVVLRAAAVAVASVLPNAELKFLGFRPWWMLADVHRHEPGVVGDFGTRGH